MFSIYTIFATSAIFFNEMYCFKLFCATYLGFMEAVSIHTDDAEVSKTHVSDTIHLASKG